MKPNFRILTGIVFIIGVIIIYIDVIKAIDIYSGYNYFCILMYMLITAVLNIRELIYEWFVKSAKKENNRDGI